ncbi:MAG: hypothetical protein AAF640_05910 [Pseudomonadota bacterium]
MNDLSDTPAVTHRFGREEHFVTASRFFRKGKDLPTARNLLRRSMRIFGGGSDELLLLALIEERLGLLDEAEGRLERLLREEPDHTVASAELGRLRLQRLDDPVGAVEPLKAAVDAGSAIPDLMRDFAQACAAAGQDGDAEQSFNRLIHEGEARPEDYFTYVRYLVDTDRHEAAANILKSVEVGGAGPWLLQEFASVATAIHQRNPDEAARIAGQGLAAAASARLDDASRGSWREFATLHFFASGFSQTLRWLDERAARDRKYPAEKVFQALLRLFVDHELPRTSFAEVRQLLSEAAKCAGAGRSREIASILLDLLGREDPREPLGSGAEEWRRVVDAASAVGRSRWGSRRLLFYSAGLWPASWLPEDGAAELLAGLIHTIVAKAPREWLAPDALLHRLEQIPDLQRLALAQALADPPASCSGDQLILLTLGKHLVDLPVGAPCIEQQESLAERVGWGLMQSRMTAGVYDPADEAPIDGIGDPRRRLKAKVDWLTRVGQFDRARSLLVEATASPDIKTALDAINRLADIGFPQEAYRIISGREDRIRHFDAILVRYRLSIYLDKRDEVEAELGAYASTVASLGKVTHVCAFLLLERIDEALAEAELLKDLKTGVTAILPAIAVCTLDWRYEQADRHFMEAIRRIRAEPKFSRSTLKLLHSLTTLFHAAQRQSLEAAGADLDALPEMENLILDLVAQRREVGEDESGLLFKSALKFSTTLLRLKHTERALRIMRELRRMARNDIGLIHELIKSYSQRSYDQDRNVAWELNRLLDYGRALAARNLSSSLDNASLDHRFIGDLTVALAIAAAISDGNLTLRLEGAAVSAVEYASGRGVVDPSAAKLAEAMVKARVGVDAALTYLNDAHRRHSSNVIITKSLIRAYRYLGRLEEAEEVRAASIAFMPFIATSLAARWSNVEANDRLVWYQARLMPPNSSIVEAYVAGSRIGGVRHVGYDISAILRRRASRGGPVRGVLFLPTYACRVSPALAALPCAELQKQGVAVVSLSATGLETPLVGDPLIDRFNNIIENTIFVRNHPKHIHETYFDWSVDWSSRKVLCMGMNFWQTLFERASRRFCGFHVDNNTASFGEVLREGIVQLDRALYVCELIFNSIAKEDFPIRFVSANWHYPPVAAFRIYCEAKGWRRNMHFVSIGIGYENYYSNFGNVYSSTAAVVDMTRHRETRAPFLAVAERFEAWYAEQSQSEIKALVSTWIQMDRAGVGSALSPEAARVSERVARHREAGKPVIGVFGKVPYDLAVPYMGGPAHSDMADWITHTVEAAAQSLALVLIKPHPHELRHEIAGRPREFFFDMIRCEIPENVILLDHKWFNIRDMIGMIDVGVLWNGTTSLELGASGVPVVVCDDWARNDYPVGHLSPQDRRHYESMICAPVGLAMPPDHQRKCAALLAYLATKEVMRPYPFIQTGITNAFVGAPRVNWDEVERYFSSGDPDVESLAREFNFDMREVPASAA